MRGLSLFPQACLGWNPEQTATTDKYVVWSNVSASTAMWPTYRQSHWKRQWATNVPKQHWSPLWQQTWYLYNSNQTLVYTYTYTKPVKRTRSAMSNSAVLQLLSEHNAIGGAGRGCWLFTDPISYCLQQASLKSVTGDSSAWMGWPAYGDTNKTGQIASDATVSISQQWNQCLQRFARWCNMWKLLLLTSQLRRSGDKRKWALACSNHVSSMLYCGASGMQAIHPGHDPLYPIY